MKQQSQLANPNLVLTYRCNFNCRHCIADAGPARSEELPLRLAKEFIDGVAAGAEIGLVGYTGGEPFLVYDSLLHLMDYSYQRHGKMQGVVTNASWAVSPEITLSKIKQLHAAGLRKLTISCDSLHLEYGDATAIKRVIDACLGLGIGVCINIVVMRSGSVCKTNLAQVLGLSPEDFEKGIMVKEFGPIMVGRARRELSAADLIASEDPSYFGGNCPFVIWTPTIAPDGSVFACCCFGDAERDPQNQIGYAGNLRQSGFAEIFAAMQNDLLLNLLAHHGPYAVLQILKSRCPDLQVRKQYFGTCDVCVELFHNPGARSELVNLLQNLKSAAQATVPA